MTAQIEMTTVTKRYSTGGEEIRALDSVDLSIATNEYVAIIGASGSGKSTLMSILGCLDRPSSGSYHLRGHDVASMNEASLSSLRNREIGFVFQSFNLLPRASALKNVMHPLMYRPLAKAERVERASAALEKVGLGARKHHLPNELSGGQRQRVAIARALVTGPSLLLADEPTGNLDSTATVDILGLFDELHAKGHTVVLVTHDHKVAMRCRRRITLHDGRIVQDETTA